MLHKDGQDILKEGADLGFKWILGSNPSLPNSLVIAVTDSGVGISQENILQLFNKFKQFRASAVRKDKMGTGLGLFIAKGIVESHGGIIGVESVEGQGTTFYFTIPI